MPADSDLTQRLREELLKGPAQRFAVLFGSRAQGRARGDSDVDIGIVPLDPDFSLSAELDLQRRLSEVSGLDVDLVRLDGDDLLLAHEAAVHGVLLHESRPGAFARFRAEATSAWLRLRNVARARKGSLARANRARWTLTGLVLTDHPVPERMCPPFGDFENFDRAAVVVRQARVDAIDAIAARRGDAVHLRSMSDDHSRDV